LVQPRGDALHLIQLGVGALQLPFLQVLADIAHELLQDGQARLRVGDVLPAVAHALKLRLPVGQLRGKRLQPLLGECRGEKAQGALGLGEGLPALSDLQAQGLFGGVGRVVLEGDAGVPCREVHTRLACALLA
jgi:hypothetical protein